MTNELKPCPFHKHHSLVSVEETPIGGRWFVGCGACGASSGLCKNKEKAIEAWNTRTPDPIIAELKEALEYCADKNNHECRDYTCGFFGEHCLADKAQQALAKLKER